MILPGPPASIPPGPKPTFQAPTQGPASTLVPTPAPGPTSGIIQVELFNDFIRTLINIVQAPAEDKNTSDSSFKSRNPNLYCGHLHMECYYFCQ